MRRKNSPYDGRRYLVDVNPLTKVVHDLENEKKSCNIHKIIKPHIKMLDTQSQVNQFLLLNEGYSPCKCCMRKKYQSYNK